MIKYGWWVILFISSSVTDLKQLTSKQSNFSVMQLKAYCNSLSLHLVKRSSACQGPLVNLNCSVLLCTAVYCLHSWLEEPVLSLYTLYSVQCTVHCDLQPVTSLTPGITAACWRISDTGLELRQLGPIQQGLKWSILFCGHCPNSSGTNPKQADT